MTLGAGRLFFWVRLLLAAWIWPVFSGPAAAQGVDPLVVDLSDHLVAITTGFAGTSVLLFGAVEDDGDVVVVVRGPSQSELVRRKERMLGLWVNHAQAVIGDAPAYYRIATSRSLERVAGATVLARHQIGLDHLAMNVRRKDVRASDDDYRKALLRLKEGAGLYLRAPGSVSFIGRRLFRTEIDLPANVPTGVYSVEVYLMKNGEVASAQTTPLIISKIGLGAQVFDFAIHRAALYGLFAVLLAAAAGWLAAAAFRKG
ncbi:TIGR02186 family protein [Telmatospirillum siberiense]|uniref:TIGR02186 family protein n=1 Tax=Telmatospirillum siberiense TaxID=382514 RepID=A0A2N3PSF4_9PROT|nr:TIGR02186 family protein [Telmatospirillum siberiense]PKU23314.1 hypothetical protein CWS72_16895 [Telmatospirillum siberiense]